MMATISNAFDEQEIESLQLFYESMHQHEREMAQMKADEFTKDMDLNQKVAWVKGFYTACNVLEMASGCPNSADVFARASLSLLAMIAMDMGVLRVTGEGDGA